MGGVKSYLEACDPGSLALLATCVCLQNKPDKVAGLQLNSLLDLQPCIHHFMSFYAIQSGVWSQLCD